MEIFKKYSTYGKKENQTRPWESDQDYQETQTIHN